MDPEFKIPDRQQWLEFAMGLHHALSVALHDPIRIASIIEEHHNHAPNFPETRFCKACVCPVVDRFATKYLSDQFNCTRYDVHRSLRCEGFQNPLYFPELDQVGFSDSPRSRSKHPGSKGGKGSSSGCSPDFAVRYPGGIRMVGEVKLPSKVTSSSIPSMVNELKHYLGVASEATSDWGHDFGYGLLYCGRGQVPLRSGYLMDWWETDNIFVSVLPA